MEIHPCVPHTSATSPTPEDAVGVLGHMGPPVPRGNTPEGSHYELPSGSITLAHPEEELAAQG